MMTSYLNWNKMKYLETYSNFYMDLLSFNPDPNNQAQEIIFSREAKEVNHSSLIISKSTLSQTTSRKLLGVLLDSSLIFGEHLISVQCNVNKTIGLFRKLQNTLPRQALITIYKA